MVEEPGREEEVEGFYEYVRSVYFPLVHSLKHVHRYEQKVKDFNFGSLIRTDARLEYAEANTIFGVSQFFLR